MAAVQKRRKYSKKRKANLRKYTNIRDIEEYIEDLSRQQKTGGVVAEKTDEELFTIETTGADVNEGSRSYNRIWKPLKCEANLVNESKIEPVVSRKAKSFKNRIKEKTRILSKKTSASVKQHGDSNKDSNNSQQHYSLWSTDGSNGKELVDEYYNEVTGKRRVKRPQSMDVHQKASLLPAMEVAHPGASYNPSFADHQDLLCRAVTVEAEKQKKTESLNKNFSLSSMSHKEREETWHKEMTKGLFDVESSSSDEGISSGGEGVDVKTPVLADRRKTEKTRRKEAERKAEELKKLEKKKESMQLNEVYRLKSIVKELQHKEVSIKAKRKSKQAKEHSAKFQAKRLGKLQYVEPDINVQLSEELTGSLRTLKPEGNIVQERLKSLQKRNRIEPRKRVMPYRRYKLKEKEKWSCK